LVDTVKRIRISIGIAVLVALSAFTPFLLRLNAHMSKSFWLNFLGVFAFVGIFAVIVALLAREDAKTDAGRINEILEQFPGPITFRSSSFRMRISAWFCGVLAAGLICFGIYSGIMGRGLRAGPDVVLAVVTFSCAAFCLVGARFAIIQSRSGTLTLDETGFELAGNRHARYLWNDVGDFRREAGRYFEGVGFRVRPPKDDPEALLNLRFTGGRDVWLPDDYGFYLRDLATLMAAWHSRATNTKPPERPLLARS
jgi:hypothetical protein